MTPVHKPLMDIEIALDEPLIHRIFDVVLDRLDTQPAAQRSNAIRINLDAQMAPEIHSAESLAARDFAWAVIESVVTAQWARIDYRAHRRHGAREERQPYLDIAWSDEIEDRVRLKFGRPRKSLSYAAQWRVLLLDHLPSYSDAALAKLAATPIMMSDRPIGEVFSRFLSIRDMAHEPFLLREVSSRVFWGLSKILDGRADAVAALLGVDECPFPEQPIVLNVHLVSPPASFLFIENHVSFERQKQRNDLPDTALIYSSGFRGAAIRLRKTGGCSLYYTRHSSQEAIAAFEQVLFSPVDFPVFFWGDLDFSGMAILAALRAVFSSAGAWKPGYEPMLIRLMKGDGHLPIEGGKERQRPIDRTGCSYADETLLPALKSSGRFLDQE